LKKFFRKLVLKITFRLLKSRFGDRLTSKLDLEAQILSKGNVVFSKKLEKDDLIKIFEHEILEIK